MIGSTLSGVVLVAIFTQLIKSFLEAFGVSTTSRFHDPLVWLTAFTIGVGGYVVSAAIDHPLTGMAARDAAGQGLLAAFSAIGAYSLATHPYFEKTPTTTLIQGEPLKFLQPSAPLYATGGNTEPVTTTP